MGNKSTYVVLLACYHQVISHNINQWRPWSILPHSITRPQWMCYRNQMHLTCFALMFILLIRHLHLWKSNCVLYISSYHSCQPSPCGPITDYDVSSPKPAELPHNIIAAVIKWVGFSGTVIKQTDLWHTCRIKSGRFLSPEHCPFS